MPEEMAARFRNRVVTEFLDEAAERTPDKVAVTGRNSMLDRVATLSFRQLRRVVDRIAAGLASMGVEKGDVVACQLPNWWQFVALHLACVRIGAITNPLMPIFRQRELRQMLGFAGTKVLVVPRSFRGCDYPAMIAEIRPDLPELRVALGQGLEVQAALGEVVDRKGAAQEFLEREVIDGLMFKKPGGVEKIGKQSVDVPVQDLQGDEGSAMRAGVLAADRVGQHEVQGKLSGVQGDRRSGDPLRG